MIFLFAVGGSFHQALAQAMLVDMVRPSDGAGHGRVTHATPIQLQMGMACAYLACIYWSLLPNNERKVSAVLLLCLPCGAMQVKTKQVTLAISQAKVGSVWHGDDQINLLTKTLTCR